MTSQGENGIRPQMLLLFLLLSIKSFPYFIYLQTDTNLPKPSKVYYQEKSPKKALLLSILPGGGQFYTKNYLKGTAFCIVQTALASATIYECILRDRAKKEGNDWNYEYFSNWLHNFFWIDGLVWAFCMGDAYISAHFYKFKEQGILEIGFRF